MDVDPDLCELNRVVGAKLPDDRDHGDEVPGLDQDAVVRAAGDQLGEVVPTGGELVDDGQQLVGLEVSGGRLAVRAACVAELTVEMGEEVGVARTTWRVTT